MHKPEKIFESKNSKILWDLPIHTDKTREYNRPDITAIDKKSKKLILTDPAFPFDTRTEKKEEEKWSNFRELKCETVKVQKMRRLKVILVVIGALRTVAKYFEKWIEKLDLDLTIEALQNPCLLGTAKVIRKVLDIMLVIIIIITIKILG